MTKEELINVKGGASINASWLNAISRGIETLAITVPAARVIPLDS